MRLFAEFFKNLSGQRYGKNEKFANFYPDLGMGSWGIFGGPAARWLPLGTGYSIRTGSYLKLGEWVEGAAVAALSVCSLINQIHGSKERYLARAKFRYIIVDSYIPPS
jgi:hypothetical protein